MHDVQTKPFFLSMSTEYKFMYKSIAGFGIGVDFQE